MATVEASVARVAPEINMYISAHEEQPGGLRHLADTIMAMLAANNLTFRQHLQPSMVGVHPDNRYGDGLSPADVHDLLDAIVVSGWSWAETTKAMAVEMPPPGIHADSIKSFNENLADSANGLLAPAQTDLMKAVSITCGHTNAGLRAVLASCKAVHTTIAGPDGRLSMASLMEKAPEMHRAAQIGLEWTVIRWELVRACHPRLLGLLQEAGNLGQKAARQESEWQCIMKAHQAATRQQAVGKCVDWKRVADGLCRYAPDLRDGAAALCKFVEMWAGGVDAPALRDIDAYVKQVQAKRRIKPAFFAALANLPLADAPLYIRAVLKAMYSAPEKHVKDGFVKMLATPDLQATVHARMKPTVVQANNIMHDARVWVEPTAMSSAEKAKAIGDLDVSLVGYIHGKTRGFRSMQHVAWTFHEACDALLGEMCPASVPASFGEKIHGKPAEVRASGKMREASASGEITVDGAELARAGFEVGVAVRAKDGTHKGLITTIDDENVVVGEGSAFRAAVFMDRFILANEPKRELRPSHIAVDSCVRLHGSIVCVLCVDVCRSVYPCLQSRCWSQLKVCPCGQSVRLLGCASPWQSRRSSWP